MHSFPPTTLVSPLFWQMEHVRLAVQDVLEDFRSDMHSDVLNMHLELIRQFEIQRVCWPWA